MYAVTGITGQVGGVVARSLLDSGQQVRAVVRDAAKGVEWAARGCEIKVAEMTDAKALAAAFSGGEGAFLLIPPVFDPTPGFAEVKGVIAALTEAIETARPPKIVCLSTIGAQATQPNLLNQLGLVEQKLGALPRSGQQRIQGSAVRAAPQSKHRDRRDAGGDLSHCVVEGDGRALAFIDDNRRQFRPFDAQDLDRRQGVAQRAEIIADHQHDRRTHGGDPVEYRTALVQRDHHAADALDQDKIGFTPQKIAPLGEKRLAIEGFSLGARRHVRRQRRVKTPGRDFFDIFPSRRLAQGGEDRGGVAGGDLPLVEARDYRLSGGDGQMFRPRLPDQRRRHISLAEARAGRGDEIMLSQSHAPIPCL